jgi:alkylation response protein AidB-like acyl-CoA dehydrogenase
LDRHAADAPPIATELDEATVAAWRVWSRLLYDAGYAGISWSSEFGGRGLSPSHVAVWLEESARAQVPDHLGVIGLDMAGPTIVDWGTTEQKRRFLPAILSCEEIWCQGFSEPGSGSDLAAATTRAELERDVWVVNGQKVWSSFAGFADWCILVVRTDFDAPKHAGLSYLLVDMHSPGVDVRPLRQITGDPEFGEIFFTDVRVPIDSMLGAPGDGWKIALTTLAHERGTHGVSLAARLAVEMRLALAALKAPRGGGASAFDDPLVRDRFAELSIELRALELANRSALAMLELTGTPGPETTIAKLHWSELNQRLTALVCESLGPAALETGNRWNYARLRARGNTIEAGTSEILRNIVAERVVGLPRSR